MQAELKYDCNYNNWMCGFIAAVTDRQQCEDLCTALTNAGEKNCVAYTFLEKCSTSTTQENCCYPFQAMRCEAMEPRAEMNVGAVTYKVVDPLVAQKLAAAAAARLASGITYTNEYDGACAEDRGGQWGPYVTAPSDAMRTLRRCSDVPAYLLSSSLQCTPAYLPPPLPSDMAENSPAFR